MLRGGTSEKLQVKLLEVCEKSSARGVHGDARKL